MVFHVSLLELVPENAQLEKDIIIEQEIYKVKKILVEKLNGMGLILYLVKWKGYNDIENT